MALKQYFCRLAEERGSIFEPINHQLLYAIKELGFDFDFDIRKGRSVFLQSYTGTPGATPLPASKLVQI